MSEENSELDNARELGITPDSITGLKSVEVVLNQLMQGMIESAISSQFVISPQHAKKIPARLALGFSYFEKKLKCLYAWLYNSNEDQNFTYDLTDQSKEYLAFFISSITKIDFAQIASYMNELDADADLACHIKTMSAQKEDSGIDSNAKYGRRLGWYAIVRAIKPRVIVKTGVDLGLGSCILASALLKNQQEGFPGYYLGTDINPDTSYLFEGVYKSVGTIICGDSLEFLSKLNQKMDLFISDSDHSPAYESREYELAAAKLAENAIVIGNNAHATNALSQFAKKCGRSFLFFAESPKNHWHPGAGMGVMFNANHPMHNISSDTATKIIELENNDAITPPIEVKDKPYCLFLNTFYGAFLTNHYARNPHLMHAGYEEQLRAIQAESFGDSDFYSKGLIKAGWRSEDLIINCQPMQQAWAKEHKITGDQATLIIEQVKILKPDVIYCQDVHYMPPDLLRALRPYTRILAAQNASSLESMPFDCYDVLFTSYPFFAEFCIKRGLEAHYIPLGFDIRSLDGISQVSYQQRPIDVSFVGGLSKMHSDRYGLFESIAKQTPLQCWGYGSETLTNESILKNRHRGEVWGKDMFRTLAHSKITINREYTRNYGGERCGNYTTNMRLFEATGCGALLITDYKDNLNDFFRVGEEVVAYRTPEECIALIKFYMAHPDKAAEIAYNGQQRTFKEHTYENRMKMVANILQKHLE